VVPLSNVDDDPVAKLSGCLADIPYAGILVRADIAVRGRRYRFRIVIDDVGLVLLDEIEKLPRADFFTRWLFPFNVAADGVDRLTECIFSDRSFRVHELDSRGIFHFGGDRGLCLIQDGIGRFGGLTMQARPSSSRLWLSSLP
jgi:hypothetical protein